MCWKRHEPDPQPSPTPMAVFVSSTEVFQSIENVTEGGVRCPTVAAPCSNITDGTPECHNGICCESNGQQFCSCFVGWHQPECDVQDFSAAQSVASAGSQQMIVGVVIAVLILVGLLIVIILMYRRKRSRDSQRNTGTSKGLPLADVNVVTNPASTSLLRNGEDTNDRGARNVDVCSHMYNRQPPPN